MTEIGDELRRDLDAAAEVEHIEVGKEIAKYDPEFRFRDLGGSWKWIVFAIAAGMSLFQLYTAGFGLLNPHVQRSVHLAFILVLTFLLFPFRRGGRKEGAASAAVPVPWHDVLLAAAGAAAGLYIFWDYQAIVLRAGIPSTTDYVLAFATILLVLEASRRIVGLPMVILSAVFLLYAYFGPHLPGIFAHKGYELTDIAEYMYLTTEGIFGIPLGVSATYIFLFILMGAYLEQAGIISFFSDLAMSVVGHTKGGAAKVAVFSSGLLGMVNGSAIANVVTTGAFTIPLMKRSGFKPHFAGAVEASASMGGQIMPPVMGAVAFIMSETLGIPYIEICKAAAIPAVLYFLGVGVMVHFEAGRTGLRGLPRNELPRLGNVLAKRWYLLIPLTALVYLLLAGYTPMFAGFYGIVLTIALIMLQSLWTAHPGSAMRGAILAGAAAAAFLIFRYGILGVPALHGFLAGACILRQETRKTLFELVKSLHNGARSALGVAIACAVIGLVVGVATMTGFGVKLSSAITSLAHGNMFLTLVFAMVSSLVLGMGVPTIPTYIITSTMAAPALAVYGVPPLVAHMFVFYFGLLADLTPPVALAAFAGAGIAKADPTKTGFTAVRLALAGFIVPFIFVYDNSLMLLNTTTLAAIEITLTALAGIVLLGAGTIGYFVTRAKVYERVVFIAAALCLIVPGLATDMVGFGLGTLAIGSQWVRRRNL
ncbi:MAG TPA: TRAP transporter permease, partial [Candidatus Deferrimicrobium sp.]|nr:TRAP transporter permease [Candidatus Deferrimicrobium sp.]